MDYSIYEILAGAGLCLLIARIVLAIHARKLPSELQESNSPDVKKGLSDVAQPQAVLVLSIEGTEQYEGDKGFLNGFGLTPKDVKDLRFVKGPASFKSLPRRAQDCLTATFEQGNSRGPGVPGLLHRGEELSATDRLYFALVSRIGVPPTVVSFVCADRGAI